MNETTFECLHWSGVNHERHDLVQRTFRSGSVACVVCIFQRFVQHCDNAMHLEEWFRPWAFAAVLICGLYGLVVLHLGS